MTIPRPQLEPGATVGIFGGGQLGRMLAAACHKLGLRAAIYAPEENSAGFDVTSVSVCGAYEDAEKVEAFARACDVLTFEFENIPVATLTAASAITQVLPPPRAVEVAQNRIREKNFLAGLGLPVVPHWIVASAADLDAAAGFLERECAEGAILKRATHGYDGKGQIRVRTRAELEEAFNTFATACVLEQRVAFVAETSVVAVRSGTGGFKAYDIPLNRHAGGILRETQVPPGFDPGIAAQAVAMTERIAAALDYTGVLTVEFFAMPDGAATPLLINEIAPRVHNSGHWTLDACAVSQFENHIRAVAGWPLGSAARHSDAVMTNLLGADILNWRRLLEEDGAVSLHLYGKHDGAQGVKEGRKLGHVTRITPRSEDRE